MVVSLVFSCLFTNRITAVPNTVSGILMKIKNIPGLLVVVGFFFFWSVCLFFLLGVLLAEGSGKGSTCSRNRLQCYWQSKVYSVL